MADIAGSYNSNQSYNPKFVWSISYSETGRSGSAVTYNFNVNFTRTNGSYGYDIIVNWSIGGAAGSRTILAANSGAASGSTSFSVTCSTDASGGTLGARIYTSSTTDSTHWMNAMDTGSCTVNKSTFNTAPSISGSVTAAGSTSDVYISEYAGSISLSWPAATDPNGNLSGYRVRVSINGGGYTELGRTNTSTRSYSHNVSNYGEGTSFKYIIDAYDSYGAWSGNIYSGTVRKNILSGGSIASVNQGVTYSESNQNIVLTLNGGYNSGGTAVTYRIYSDSVTIYNQRTISSLTETVVIWRTGTAPTGPYIKWQDIVNLVSSTGYTGTLHLGLVTSNSYGTNRYSSGGASIDIKTNPNPSSSCTITEGSASTAYRTSSGTSLSYFVPKAGGVIEVKWTAGSGKLGETIKYDLYVAYGSGSWQLVNSDMSSTTLSYLHAVPEQTAQTTIKYMIRTKTSYGNYSDTVSTAKNIHYYTSPQLTPGTITRESTQVTVAVTVKSVSSVPNINTVGTWIARKTGTTVNIASGSLSVSQTAQNIVVTGLTDADTYEIIVTYNDNTGWSTNGTATIAVAANSPVFFINKYGIGVGGDKASASYPITVKGGIFASADGYFNDGLLVGGDIECYGNISTDNAITSYSLTSTNINGTTITGYNVYAEGSGKKVRMCQPNASYAWIDTDATAGLYSNQPLYVKGEVYVGPSYNQRVYHPGNKPTPSDIGAAPVTHDHLNLVTRNTEGGFDKSKTGFQRPNSVGIPYGLTMHVCHPNFTNGEYSRGIGFDYGDSLNIYTYGYSSNGSVRKETRILTSEFMGDFARYATRITNLNTFKPSGIYSYSSGATGAPSSYGILIHGAWNEYIGASQTGSDFSQIAIDLGTGIYRRSWVNGAWSGWRTI